MTITQEDLKRLLNYDPDTGVFRWKISGYGIKIGKIAGCIRKGNNCKPYCILMINRKSYYAHRIAWLYMHGEFPKLMEIDHIDGNGLNNKWNNLREVSRSENSMNMRIFKTNKSGVTGVYWNKYNDSWQVQINIDMKQICLGFFDNIFDAACVRKSAEEKYGYHKNHGSNRPL